KNSQVGVERRGVRKMINLEEKVQKIEQNEEENTTSISFLRGYIKGLEERISRLERSKGC
ncbi:TPA: hypothetical protein ACGL52_000831, partial [Streptococcus agalactiae]